ICPLVKCAAAFQIEAGMVPVAGQNAVVHGAPLEREAHVRATVIYSVNLVIMGKERQRMAVEMHDLTSGCLHVINSSCANQMALAHFFLLLLDITQGRSQN